MHSSKPLHVLALCCLAALAGPVLGQSNLPKGARFRLGSASNPLLSVDFSPDSKQIALGGYDDCIEIWSTTDGKKTRRWRTPEGSVACLRFTPDGKFLASGSIGDSVIHLWDPASGKQVREFLGLPRGVTSLSFSPDGKYLAAGGYGTDEIHLWLVASGQEIKALSGPNVPPPSENIHGMSAVQFGFATFAPDGRTLASGHGFGLVRVWDISKKRELQHFRTDVSDSFTHVAYSHTGRALATWGESIRLWSPVAASAQDVNSITAWAESMGLATPAGWKLRRAFGDQPGAQISTLSFSMDDRLLATGSTGETATDGLIHVWETATGTERFRLSGHDYAITATAFSSDAHLLATASRDGTALLWDLQAFRTLDSNAANESVDRLETCWADLGHSDAKVAFRAMRSFGRSSKETVAFLQKHLQAQEPVTRDQLKRWISALDSKSFKQRETAAASLADHFEVAESFMKAELPKQTSTEGRRRLEQVLRSCELGSLTGEQLRLLRGIELLENVGSSEAATVLARLTAGDGRLLPTREAQAALERIKHRRHP